MSKLLYRIGYINNGVEVTKENQHEHVHPINKSFDELKEDLYTDIDYGIKRRGEIINLTNIDFSTLSFGFPCNDYNGYGFFINNRRHITDSKDCLMLDFSGSDFTDAYFNDCPLTHCKFNECNFTNASAYKAEFHSCDFDKAIFDNFEMCKRGFHKCKMTNIDLSKMKKTQDWDYKDFASDNDFTGSTLTQEQFKDFTEDERDLNNLSNIKING